MREVLLPVVHRPPRADARGGGGGSRGGVRVRRRREDGFPFGVLDRRGVARDDLLRVARDEDQHPTPGAQVPPPLRRPGRGRRRADPATGAPAAGEPPPDPGRSDAEEDPDVAFAKTLRSLELCADAGLVDVGLGVARAAAADARARGDETGAVAWLHRAGDVAGVAALALEQLPTPHVASADPSGAALALVRLAMGHPGAAEAAAR